MPRQRKHSFIINVVTDKPCTAGPAMKAVRRALQGQGFYNFSCDAQLGAPDRFHVKSLATVKRGASPEVKTET